MPVVTARHGFGEVEEQNAPDSRKPARKASPLPGDFAALLSRVSARWMQVSYLAQAPTEALLAALT